MPARHGKPNSSRCRFRAPGTGGTRGFSLPPRCTRRKA